MMRARWLTLAIGSLCALAAPGVAATINISGLYQVYVAQSSPIDPADNCVYRGEAALTQSGSNVSGHISLTLVSGGCESTSLVGPVTGTIVGNLVSFDAFGIAFPGTVSNNGNSMSGTWDPDDPESEATGVWSAQRGAPAPAPVVSPFGLVGVMLLLGWVGVRYLRSV